MTTTRETMERGEPAQRNGHGDKVIAPDPAGRDPATRPEDEAPAQDAAATAAPPAVAPRTEPSGAARAMDVAGKVIFGVSLLVLGCLVVAFGVGMLTEARSQHLLLVRFNQEIVTQTLDAPTSVPADGSPVAILAIPAIGLRQVVVQGTSPGDLEQGPGHYPNTAMPGEYGNAVIAGRRTTFGHPFLHLNDLRSGDQIAVITGQGRFTYLVRRLTVVSPGQPDVLGPSLDSRLTLLTSDPVFLATKQLVVVAALVGKPVAVPDRPPVALTSDEVGLGGDVNAFGPALFWGLLLIAAIVGTAWVRRRHSTRLALLLGCPVILGLLLLAAESLSRMLPATL